MLKEWSRKNWKPIIFIGLAITVVIFFIGEFHLFPIPWGIIFVMFFGLDQSNSNDIFGDHYEIFPNKKFEQSTHLFGKYMSIISYHFMMADGKIDAKEKQYYLKFLKDEFENKKKTEKFLNIFETFDKNKLTLEVTVKKLMNEIDSRDRVRLLHYLVALVTQDNFLSVDEIAMLRKLCKYLNIHYKTLDAVLALYNYTSEEDLNKRNYAKTFTSESITKHYKILELDKDATENDIKTAYRKLVKLYHPDKLTTNTKFTKEQFQIVQEAYEKVKKHKNIK